VDTVDVTVNPIPEITSLSKDTICSGAPTIYNIVSSVPGAAFAWGRGFVAGIANPPVSGQTSNIITENLVNSTVTLVSTTYIITPYANGCVGPAFNYEVAVYPTPEVNSLAAKILCSGENDVYTISGTVAGSSFAWSRDAVTGISNAAATNQMVNPISETLVNTINSTVFVDYKIIPTANGCTGPTFTYRKTVKPTPLAPTVTDNGPLCVGADLFLGIVNPIAGASYNWTGPNGFSSTQLNPSRLSVDFADGGSYNATATVNGCTSPAGVANVNVSNQPSTANAGIDQTICAGNTINLFGTITGGSSSGMWSTSGSGSFAPSSTFLTSTYTPSNADTAAGSVILTLTSTNNGACAASSHSIVVTISDAPTVNAGADQNICAYKTVSLNGNVTVANGGLWTSSGTGTFQPSPTTLNAVYVPSTSDIASGNVTLRLTTTGTGTCRVVNDQLNVTILPAPTVNVGPDKIILLGQSVSLQPSVGGTVSSFQWSPNIWISGATQQNAIVTPQDDTTYVLVVTAPSGCIATDSVKITVLFPPQIPNVFSPNGDGINDKWEVPHLAKYPGCTVQIFTRYGQQVYYSDGYDNPWDGTHKGKPMPVGTYYYVIEPKNGVPRFSGYVVLLR
jgi:gliding motility-associated-like protein